MATNGHSGYPLKWFKDQNAARHAYECAICLEVLKDPVQIRDCGHQFCALCIDDILKSDPKCPSCRIKISDAMIFEDHAARRLIKQLDVNCCNEGCSWQGSLSSLLQNHQNSCNSTRSGNNVNHLDVGELEQKLETVMLKVSALEKKHEQDIKDLKLKHEQDIKELKVKLTLERENELIQVKAKHAADVILLGEKIELLQAMGTVQASQVVLQQPLPCRGSEPTFTWKITNFRRKLAQAKSDNKVGVTQSEPFFSSHGYKMKLRANLNEGLRGYCGYMGVYVCFIKSDQDATLSWPFAKRFTLILIDQQDNINQRENIKKTLVPHGEKGFGRPQQLENTSSQGKRQFVLQVNSTYSSIHQG
ncbi:TNF receptor-associated factor 2 isoform X2 [Paramuricea clavata]|uniref:TNF receptor-associated factor 2 isoform X2 n=1 Tax=Paramuricea clavata TaxID=317549 RepID=A0A6S7L6E8_PARCT|nr:TNF receptor-associated factor 2 isoform X2 [Paramuricea clavata]